MFLLHFSLIVPNFVLTLRKTKVLRNVKVHFSNVCSNFCLFFVEILNCIFIFLNYLTLILHFHTCYPTLFSLSLRYTVLCIAYLCIALYSTSIYV